MADLEALIAADPDNVDPDVLAAADELRQALAAVPVGTPVENEVVEEEEQVEDEGGSVKRKRGDEEDDVVANPDVNRAPNGERMHPRNQFKETNPDFGALAERQPFLKPFLKKRGKGRFGIDFTKWVGLHSLPGV